MSKEPSAGFDKEPSAGFDKEPSAGFDKEPSAGFDKEPSAGFDNEPSAGFDKEPSAGFDKEPSAGFDKKPSAGFDKELLQWGVAALALEDNGVSGDLSLVVPFADGALVAVVDGLGHGAEAALPAQSAVDILRRYAGESPISLIERCHDRLRLTRGVVMSLASLSARENTLTWAGIGNVEGRLIRNSPDAKPPCEFLCLNSGTVGDRIPRMHVTELPVFVGDTLVFATDGIHNRGLNRMSRSRKGPMEMAKNILNQYARGDDDALVLVARSLIGNK